jgi:hypothetical protein
MTCLQAVREASTSEDAKLNDPSKAGELEDVSVVEPPFEPPEDELFLFFLRPHFLH